MGVSLSIKDVPEALAERLRRRAEANHRSLQGELMAIIERAAAEPTAAAAPMAVSGQHGRGQGWQTVEHLMAERLATGWQPDPAMARLPRGVDIIRADRDSR